MPREPFSILLVCTGNICRSPSAEGVMRAMAAARGLGEVLRMDSAGTSSWHVGEPPDPPAIRAAAARGYDLTPLRARQAVSADFQRFDLILAMDHGHYAKLERLRQTDAPAQLALYMAAVDRADLPEEVFDPYGMGPGAFGQCLDLIEAGAAAWLDRLVREARI